MPTGSAKQTTIAFNTNKDSPLDDASNSGTNGGVHVRSDDDRQQISAAQKRSRNEFEDMNTDDDANHLNVLTTSLTSNGSATSLFSSGSVTTIRNVNDQGTHGPQEYRAPDRSPFLLKEDDTERIKIVRLERLRDKEDRSYKDHTERPSPGY